MVTEGERIRLIRDALKLSQKALGKILSLHPSFISAAENNNKFLSREKLIYLLVNYNVNINYILAGKGEMFLTDNSEQPSDKLRKIIKEEIAEALKVQP